MFEERYVAHVLDLARQMKMTQIGFAAAVWPEMTRDSANTTIIALKSGNSRGKKQNLRVSDAVRMAQIIGREYPSLCFEVWEKLRYELQEQDASSSPRRTTLMHPEIEKAQTSQKKRASDRPVLAAVQGDIG